MITAVDQADSSSSALSTMYLTPTPNSWAKAWARSYSKAPGCRFVGDIGQLARRVRTMRSRWAGVREKGQARKGSNPPSRRTIIMGRPIAAGGDKKR